MHSGFAVVKLSFFSAGGCWISVAEACCRSGNGNRAVRSKENLDRRRLSSAISGNPREGRPPGE
jgi:hypothetical protein